MKQYYFSEGTGLIVTNGEFLKHTHSLTEEGAYIMYYKQKIQEHDFTTKKFNKMLEEKNIKFNLIHERFKYLVDKFPEDFI